MILAKYGILVSQEALATVMETTEPLGTKPSGIVKGLRHYKVSARLTHGLSMEQLIRGIKELGESVILDIDAYGCSHYVCLIGESRRNWLFADPMAENGLGFIAKRDFIPHWPKRLAIIASRRRATQSKTLPVHRITR